MPDEPMSREAMPLASMFGRLKIEGEPYRLFRQWDSRSGDNRYWCAREGSEKREPLEKTSNSTSIPAWYKDGRKLPDNVSSAITRMERDYRVGRAVSTADAAGDEIKAAAPAPKIFERALLGTLIIDGDSYKIFRTWMQSETGAYGYERVPEGAELGEAIYKQPAGQRSIWHNASGRGFDAATSTALSKMDEKAGYEEMLNFKPPKRNFNTVFHPAKEQKKPAAKPVPGPASTRLEMVRQAMKRTEKKPERTRRAPLRPRKPEIYEDDEDVDERDADKRDGMGLMIAEGEVPAIKYKDFKRKLGLD